MHGLTLVGQPKRDTPRAPQIRNLAVRTDKRPHTPNNHPGPNAAGHHPHLQPPRDPLRTQADPHGPGPTYGKAQ